MGIGVTAYVTSIFFQAMFSDLNWSRGDLALSMSVGAILAAIVSPFVGAFVDKHGASRIMAISAFATGGCLISLGYIHELWEAFVIFSLLAVFRVGFVSIPVMAMVSNWFSRKRGRAMGIATAGQGLGGFILSPLSVYLISSLGWRLSWGVMGFLTWVVMIPAALFVAKPKPEVMGLLADGDTPEARTISPADREIENAAPDRNKRTLKDILRMPAFWFIASLHSLYLFGHLSIFQHAYSLFTDKGIPAMTVGTMIGILGLFSLIGKITLGYLSDRISVRYVMIIALVLAAGAVIPLFLTDQIWGNWLFIVFWGFWECGVIALQPILVASYFDRAIVGKMLGIFSIFSVLPQLIGAPFMGYVFDITGSYNLALFAFIICYIISAGFVFLIRRSKQTVSLPIVQK
jgi:MFS family permease